MPSNLFADEEKALTNQDLLKIINKMQAQIDAQEQKNIELQRQIDLLKSNKYQNPTLVTTAPKLEQQANTASQNVYVVSNNATNTNTNTNTQVAMSSQNKPDPKSSYFISLLHDDLEFDQTGWYKSFPGQNVALNVLQAQSFFPKNALIFGGMLQTDLTAYWGSRFTGDGTQIAKAGRYDNGYNFNLNKANFDIISNWGSWLQTVITLNGAEVQGSTLINGFLTVGNLEEFPFFLTLGKNRIPMGSYAGSAPLLSGFAGAFYKPAQFSNVLIAYDKNITPDNNVNLNISAFNPGINGRNKSTDNGGFLVSGFYAGKQKLTDGNKLTYGLNASYLYNSSGTGMGSAQYITNGTVQSRSGQNPVVGVEGDIGFNEYDLAAGYYTNVKEQTYTDNARASVWYIQAKYSPLISIFGDEKATTFSVGYNHGNHTQSFTFPLAGQAAFGPVIDNVKQQANFYIQRAIYFQNLIMAIEYGWLGMYNGQHTSEVTWDTKVYF